MTEKWIRGVTYTEGPRAGKTWDVKDNVLPLLPLQWESNKKTFSIPVAAGELAGSSREAL